MASTGRSESAEAKRVRVMGAASADIMALVGGRSCCRGSRDLIVRREFVVCGVVSGG
jgi:hypothetical protein